MAAPPALEADTVYSEWKLEVELWQGLTDLPENKQGLALTSAIAADHPLAIRKKVLKNLGLPKLKTEEGVESLVTYLDSILAEESEEERSDDQSPFGFEYLLPKRKGTDHSSEECRKSKEESDVSEASEEETAQANVDKEVDRMSPRKETQDAEMETTVKGIQKLTLSKTSDEKDITMSPTTETEWQSFQEERRRQRQEGNCKQKKGKGSLQQNEHFLSEDLTRPSSVKKKQTMTMEAENVLGKGATKTVSSFAPSAAGVGTVEAMPEILLSVLTERLGEKFGHKGHIQVAGLVLSTLAMSEIGMLLGVISNPLTLDPYKLAMIKQMEMLKSIDKKLDKIMCEPLTSAIEKLSDVFALLKEGEQAKAKDLLDIISDKSQKAKNYDLPFPLHAQAVKIFIFAEIMKLQYDPGEENRDETGKPIPFFTPTFKLKQITKDMIQNKLKAAKGELEKTGQKKKNFMGQSTQVMKEEYQNVIDGFLQAQYNVLSICKDFTKPTKMVDQQIKFKLATDFFPVGEEDSTPLPLGVLEKKQEALVCWVWKDTNNAFLRIGMRKFTLQLKHAHNKDIQVQLTKTPDGKYYDLHYGEDLKVEAQPENGKLPPKMKKIQELMAEAECASSVLDLSLEAYQAAASISPDYLKFLKIDFSEVDRRDKRQNTLLHFIAQTPCSSSKAQKEKAKTIIDIVVKSGGNEVLTKQNVYGMSPIMLGLKKKQTCMPMLKILLDLFKTDEAEDINGDNLVHYAARYLQDKDVEFLNHILDKLGRGFLRVLNKDEKTPYDIASSRKIKEALSIA